MDNFKDQINLMLLAACIVSLIIGYINEGLPNGLIEGTSIAIALLIIVSVNSGNNYISERRLADLVKLSDQQKVDVYRNNEKTISIDGEDLVVGDLFYFESG
jgi:Ca2+-transporting ATPase